MINYGAIEILLAVSIGVWGIVNKTPLKTIVKGFVLSVYPTNWEFKFLSRDNAIKYSILTTVASLTAVFLWLVQSIDAVAVIPLMGEELQWVNQATEVSALNIIHITPDEMEPLYYVDQVLTVTLIVLGSSSIHRVEKWMSGNSLLTEVIRGWLLKNGYALDSRDAGKQM